MRALAARAAFLCVPRDLVILTALGSCWLAGCSIPPKLTPEQRRQDIEYLAQWAADCSPFVQLNEQYKNTPSYRALKAQYMAFAEGASSNEDFFLVLCGYIGVIGASGHAYLLSEDVLQWSALGATLGIDSWGISPAHLRDGVYWARLAAGVSMRAHPPFRIVFREGRYFTGENWSQDGVVLPAGSEIINVDGMTCRSFLDYVKTHTHLRYDAYPKDWADKYLLIVDEGPAHRGWQITFRGPDGSTTQRHVPKLPGLPSEPGRVDPVDAKDNCACLPLTNDVGYIRVKTMWRGPLSITFKGYMQEERRTIRTFLERAQGRYDKLIIDVRNNNGGDPEYVDQVLIRPFLDRPVTVTHVTGMRRAYLKNAEPSVVRALRRSIRKQVVETKEVEPPAGFDRRDWVFHAITRRFTPANRYPFTGRLYVLVDAGTFSAADDYADLVKRARLGLLVGQNTGGGGAGYLAPPAFRLPGSGTIWRMEADLLLTPGGGVNELFGTEPDIKLPAADRPRAMTTEELLKDPWIRAILSGPPQAAVQP